MEPKILKILCRFELCSFQFMVARTLAECWSSSKYMEFTWPKAVKLYLLRILIH